MHGIEKSNNISTGEPRPKGRGLRPRIKFRAWSKVLKLMTYDIKISDLDDFTMNEPKDPDIYLNDAIENYQKLSILMQYIGTNDKYGREIYEGDVVKWIYPYYDDHFKSDEIYGLVEWDDVDCQFKIIQLNEGFYEYGCGSKEKLEFYGHKRNFEFHDLQIMGNICKNPEFMNIEETIKEEERQKEEEIRKKEEEERRKEKERKKKEKEREENCSEIRRITI